MQKEEALNKLFESWSWEKADSITTLPASGSVREYYRLVGRNKSAVGVYNPDRRENIAFINLTTHFQKKNLPVPQFYAEDLSNNIYLIKDLGDTTLYSIITDHRSENGFSEELKNIYLRIIETLPKFQISGGDGLDYKVCYPRSSFDRQSIMWDLNYFKYYFLKLAKIQFDEQTLEDDFNKFTSFLLQTDCGHFLYRDFQSRNIMILDDQLYFIDYQGGRRGALQYDIASLLFDAKADIPANLRVEFLEYYINELKKYVSVNNKVFTKYFYGYAFVRMMQAMGAYGYRGFYEKKGHFLKSIPYALKNLKWIIDNSALPISIPTLMNVFEQLVTSKELQKFEEDRKSKDKLTVTINSFSYRKDIPIDTSGNGGGFVFDCRALHNPGRYDEFKELTGKDKKVIEFLNKEDDTKKFLENVFAIVDQSVEEYLKRGFLDLMISFGCTGGQHRSVYCAEGLAEHLREKHSVNVIVRHWEILKGEGKGK